MRRRPLLGRMHGAEGLPQPRALLRRESMQPHVRPWSGTGLQGRHDDVPPGHVRSNLSDLLSCHFHGLPVLELSDDSFEGPMLSAYRAGDKIADKYTLLESLGLGGMGEVWAA